jgi:2-polyprenyl-6-hydroxyphenyl methylase/3-demethylubiquinone-9 3-methyltransferase
MSDTVSEEQRVERSVPGLHNSLIKKISACCSKEGAILDLGCGTGAWLQRLAADGYTNLYGVDADIDSTSGVRASVSRADLNSHDWCRQMGSFDLITAIEVLEHLENPGLFLGQVAEILAADGRALITTPNVHSVLCRVRYLLNGKLKQFDEKGDPTHIYPVFIENLEKLLGRHGLVLEEFWGYPENGKSLTSRSLLNLVAGAMRLALPEKAGGDVLCVLIRKAQR